MGSSSRAVDLAPQVQHGHLENSATKKGYRTEIELIESQRKPLKTLTIVLREPILGHTFLAEGQGLRRLIDRCIHETREQGKTMFIVTEPRRVSSHAFGSKFHEHVSRIGYQFPDEIVQAASEKLISRPIPNPILREPVTDEEKRAAIREFFPRTPAEDVEAIIRQAWQTGRVGTATTIDLGRRIQLAVNARIRHNCTNYDQMLDWLRINNPEYDRLHVRRVAREAIQREALEVLKKWRGEDNETMDATWREIIVIDDEEETDPVGELLFDGAHEQYGSDQYPNSALHAPIFDAHGNAVSAKTIIDLTRDDPIPPRVHAAGEIDQDRIAAPQQPILTSAPPQFTIYDQSGRPFDLRQDASAPGDMTSQQDIVQEFGDISPIYPLAAHGRGFKPEQVPERPVRSIEEPPMRALNGLSLYHRPHPGQGNLKPALPVALAAPHSQAWSEVQPTVAAAPPWRQAVVQNRSSDAQRRHGNGEGTMNDARHPWDHQGMVKTRHAGQPGLRATPPWRHPATPDHVARVRSGRVGKTTNTTKPSPSVQASTSATQDPNSQYGTHQDYNLRAQHGSLSAQERELSSTPKADAFDASLEENAESSGASAVFGLKTPSPPLGHRVSEYESLSPAISSGKGSNSPAFEIVRRPGKALIEGSPIAKLPNEILTHALSHLSATDLQAAALVCRRFHSVVTSPHAWRAAFARFFPGPTALKDGKARSRLEGSDVYSDKRAFTRLTMLATWRSEYIIRTRLLKSVARGKPMQHVPTAGNVRVAQNPNPAATVMYNSHLRTTVNHLHATFGTGLAKRFPQFIHGADDEGTATSSDPMTGGVANWGLNPLPPFPSFSFNHPGHPMYGLGSGEIIGNPNVMDVSQPHGMVYGVGYPGGDIVFRAIDEQLERVLTSPSHVGDPDIGIPRVEASRDGFSSIWIAKTPNIPSLTDGLVGFMSGSHLGIVTAYSLGRNDLQDPRLGRGEVTARWVLSPGVPIVAIVADEKYSLNRQAQNRMWVVALNALGELFYLTKFPKRAAATASSRTEQDIQRRAWLTGRSVNWNLVEPSRRVSRPDPYADTSVDGSYTPRSSWNGMCLSVEQIRAETAEIEAFMKRKAIEFRRICHGWDMQRRLEVDFAGDDGNFAGEALVVFKCGLDEDSPAAIRRFTRVRVRDGFDLDHQESDERSPPDPPRTPAVAQQSRFGPSPTFALQLRTTSRPLLGRGRSSSSLSRSSGEPSPDRGRLVEEWRQSEFTLAGLKNVQISTTTLDISTYAVLTISEDPALGMTSISETSSPFGSPIPQSPQLHDPADLPGQRARFVAAGTKSGCVVVWNVRAPLAKSADLVNSIEPLRLIYTDSPEISCLGMTALQLVHGGNDGLVQVWDPLASSMSPIRTLNSRFSSRARRRLIQAQASPQGVGINLFAAGAVVLDPDPTMLRGMVALGTYLRYWSYSSSVTDQYKGSKRRPRRSERGSNNHGGERFSGIVRNSNLKKYIASERAALEYESRKQRKEKAHLTNRFGVGMLGTDEEAMAYARMLSEESLTTDEERRRGGSVSTPAVGTSTRGATTHEASPRISSQDEYEAEIAEAIQRSLDEEAARINSVIMPASPAPTSAPYDVPFRVSTKKNTRSPRNVSRGSPSFPGRSGPESSLQQEADDLRYALQLSLAEEESRKEGRSEGGADDGFGDVPKLGGSSVKGKGKNRMS